jgi:hypothetical protein
VTIRSSDGHSAGALARVLAILKVKALTASGEVCETVSGAFSFASILTLLAA